MINYILPNVSVSNLKNIFFIIPIEFYRFLIFLNLKPFGLADLTASTVLDAVPHRRL